MSKFKVGDEVEVLRGTWFIVDGKIKWFDEDTIGSIGIITEASTIQNIDQYAIKPTLKKGNNLRHAWFNNNDLKLKYRPRYNKNKNEKEN